MTHVSLSECNLSLRIILLTAAGVVPFGCRKTSPRTSSIVQIVFYFSPFEIGGYILNNQKQEDHSGPVSLP